MLVVILLFLGAVIASWLYVAGGTVGMIGGVCLAAVLVVLVCFVVTRKVCDGVFQHMDDYDDSSRLLGAKEDGVQASGKDGTSTGWDRGRLMLPSRVGDVEERGACSYGAIGR